MTASLLFKVERKSSKPGFETIAIFHCAAAARLYAADCQTDNPGFIYRVVTAACERAWNRWDASRPWLVSEEE